jgi:hypothetical protein
MDMSDLLQEVFVGAWKMYRSCQPAYLSKRDDAENNITSETWTSHHAKKKMEKEFCNALRDNIKKMRLTCDE